jgi:5'-nucleotidase (lipoprotein e(P4) family)
MRKILGVLTGMALATSLHAETWSRPDLASQAWPGSEYVYGSGEGLAISEQVYATLVDYVRAQRAMPARRRRSVLLDMTSMKAHCGDDQACMLDKPIFAPCDGKPTVVLDADETLLLNLGFEYDAVAHATPFTDAHWAAWERQGIDKVAAVPGAVEAIRALRAMGVDPVIITNRDALDPSNFASTENFGRYTEQALAHAGFPGFHHGQNLFLRFDDGDRDPKNSGKDARRASLAKGRCVIAMVGDQLGDFSDLFARSQNMRVRRGDAERPAFAKLWGRGWFVLPNAVYGNGVPDGRRPADVFPYDDEWPAREPAAP